MFSFKTFFYSYCSISENEKQNYAWHWFLLIENYPIIYQNYDRVRFWLWSKTQSNQWPKKVIWHMICDQIHNLTKNVIDHKKQFNHWPKPCVIRDPITKLLSDLWFKKNMIWSMAKKQDLIYDPKTAYDPWLKNTIRDHISNWDPNRDSICN